MQRNSLPTALSASVLLILAVFVVSIECNNYTSSSVPFFGFMNEENRNDAMEIYYRQQNGNSSNEGSSSDYSCGIAGKRRTLDGKTACKRFCGLDEDNNCHEVEYILSITMGALAGFVLAILSILAFFVFLCGRCVCNCFGGRKASKGVCCGNVYDFEGYSTKHIWIMKILLIVVFAGIVACAIVGYVANGKTNKGADTFFGTIIDFAQTLIDKVTVIGDLLDELPYSSGIGEKIGEATTSANGIVNSARDVRTTANDYNHYRYSALIASFAVPLFFVLVGVVAALFNFGALSMASALFTFFCSFVIWISFGIHNLVSVLLTDLCFEIDAYLDGTSGSEPNVALQQLLKCANGGAFSEIREMALNALQTAFNATCTAADNVCDIPGTNCQADYANNCSRATISAFVNTTITDFLVGCSLPGFDCPDNSGACPDQEKNICYSNTLTIQSCTTDCNNTEIKDYSSEIVYNLGVAIKYDIVIQDHILPLLDCSYISEAFSTVQDSICVTVKDATDNIYVASLILAILLIPATVLMILGCKRFNKSNNEDMYENDVEMRS